MIISCNHIFENIADVQAYENMMSDNIFVIEIGESFEVEELEFGVFLSLNAG